MTLYEIAEKNRLEIFLVYPDPQAPFEPDYLGKAAALEIIIESPRNEQGAP